MLLKSHCHHLQLKIPAYSNQIHITQQDRSQTHAPAVLISITNPCFVIFLILTYVY